MNVVAPVGLTAILGAPFTVKLTVIVREVMLAPLTVSVAVYVPAANPAFGRTVNVRVPPLVVILANEVAESVKLLAFVPLSAAVIAPVAVAFPLVTVTVCAAG